MHQRHYRFTFGRGHCEKQPMQDPMHGTNVWLSLERLGRNTTKLTVAYSRPAYISYADVSFIALARQARGDEAMSYGGAISVTKRCSYCWRLLQHWKMAV